jgi:DNA gyrase subunit B
MPELVERGHIYIAQPPLYKVKVGKHEQYLKDAHELDAFLLKLALTDAKISPGKDKLIIEGEALAEVARKYQLADSVINRLSAWMDAEALRAIMNGVAIELDDLASAEASGQRLSAALKGMGSSAEVAAQFDTRSDKHVLAIVRQVHGNKKVSTITADFAHGGDYAALREAALTFEGLIEEGAVVMRGDGEKQKESPVASFREAMLWLLQQAESSVGRQRYKGLGEMNPEQLWETTMDPTVRRLLRVQIDDAIEADRVFTTLMGDEVEPRRHFIESNALRAANIDV